MGTLPTGTVTFLFSDIEKSTRRWEQDPVLMNTVLLKHDEILRNAIEECDGYVFKTVGDAFCAAFHTAIDGVSAAIHAQLEIQSTVWRTPDPLRVRIGIHTGEAVERNGDYYGQPVNRTARLESAAHGGQVLLSLVTAELSRDSFEPEVSLIDLGEHRLKDLTRFEHVYQLSHPALPKQFPSLNTLDLHPNNLPIQPTLLVGRRSEIDFVMSQFINKKTRLVTLVGIGGIGKTRLALQLAADLVDQYKDGAFFVDFSNTRKPDLVSTEIARALSISIGPDENPADAAVRFLEKKALLLVLDNFEQILDAAKLVTRIQAICPHVHCVVTSREPLRLRGEIVFHVAPLSLPERPDPASNYPDQLSQYDAVQLFINRILGVKPGFTVNNENAPTLAEICLKLEGIPLAIELAAARAKILSLDGILLKLRSRLGFLTKGLRDLPGRQQTLRATIEWSYGLLNEDEKKLFQHLSIFRGGFTVDAVEAICADEFSEEVFDLLESLADKNLVRLHEDRGDVRFSLMETIGEYATEVHRDNERRDYIRIQHAEYYTNLCKQLERKLDDTHDYTDYINTIKEELSNIREAKEFLSERNLPKPLLKLVGGLWQFWHVWGLVDEGRNWLRAAMEIGKGSDGDSLAKALFADGVLAIDAGEYGEAEQHLEHGLRMFLEFGNRKMEAESNHYLGWAHYRLGHLQMANHYFNKSSIIAENLNDEILVAKNYNALGLISRRHDDDVEAERYFQESLIIFRRHEEKRLEANVTCNLGLIYGGTGEIKKAIANLRSAKATSEELGLRNTICICLYNLGYYNAKQGSVEEALSFYRELVELSAECVSRNMLSLCHVGIADALVSLNKPEEAATHVPLAIDYAESYGSFLELGNSYRVEGELRLAQQRYTEAQDSFDRCLPYLEFAGESDMTRRVFVKYNKVLAGLGRKRRLVRIEEI